jgi:transcriptional regulator with XRE-family HTH domain
MVTFTMTMLARRIDPIDLHVAQRLKLRRMELGWSQDKLGQAVGVSFQMIQKYERGDCRMAASRLMKIAEALETSVGWLYGVPQAPAMRVAEEAMAIDESLLNRRETMELLKLYYALPEAVRPDALAILHSLQRAEAHDA